MKGSLLKGDIKDASASPLRAFSGIPRCGIAGATDIVYRWNVQFDNLGSGANVHGHVRLVLQNPNFNTATDAKPLGKWTAVFKLNLDFPIPTVDEHGNGTNPSAAFAVVENPTTSDSSGFSAAIIKGKGQNWSPLEIKTPGIGDGTFTLGGPIGETWRIAPEIGQPLFTRQGPDLVEMMHFDWSQTGVQQQVFQLPEQVNFCGVLFYPFIKQIIPDGFSGGSLVWESIANSAGILVPRDIGLASIDGAYYSTTAFPNGTILGTLTMTFIRGPVTVLFVLGISPLRKVSVQNTSLYGADFAPTWDWDWGDGSAHDTAANPPPHDYAANGTYKITLTATDVTGAVHSFDQQVRIPLKADFTVHVNPGLIVQSADFTDKSIGAVTWDWDFGDGSPHSTIQHPASHNYVRHSTFTVTLKVGDSLGNFDSKSIVITTT